jgi:hypothetical protein
LCDSGSGREAGRGREGAVEGGRPRPVEAGGEVVVVAEAERRRALCERVGLWRRKERGRERRASVCEREGWRVRQTPSYLNKLH